MLGRGPVALNSAHAWKVVSNVLQSANCEGTKRQNHSYEDSPQTGNDEDTHVVHLHQVDDITNNECEYD